MKSNNSLKTVDLIIISTLFYSINQLFNKRLTENISELKTLVVIYFYLTLLDLLVFLYTAGFHVPKPSAWVHLFITSAVGTVAIYYFFKALRVLPVGVALTLANFSPIFLTFINFFLEGKAPSGIKLLLIALSPLPLYLIAEGGGGRVALRYYIYPLITALGWAIFGYELYHLTQREKLSPFAVAFYSSLLMFLFLLLSASLKGELKKSLEVIKNPRFNLWAFLSALFTSAGFILSTLAFSVAPPEELPVLEAILTFTTPLATLFAYLFLGEKLSKRQLVGIALSFFLLVAFVLL
jgi:drug/metabolite transporter (DMT)-like permease